jgi:hypothetical protein
MREKETVGRISTWLYDQQRELKELCILKMLPIGTKKRMKGEEESSSMN